MNNRITTSESINELATALAKAQAVMEGAKKGSENPHFRSKYADLASVWEACRKALTDHGLAIVQSPRISFMGGEGDEANTQQILCVEVETRLLHTSGQWMADTLSIPVTKADAHGVGAAITYGRRFALGAFVGIAPEDDDGNAAVSTQAGPRPVAAVVRKPKDFDNWFADISAVAENGWDILVDAWKSSPEAMRNYTLSAKPAEWDAVKVKAKAVKA